MRVSSAILDRLIEEGMEEEVDLDRLLWVPRERTYFLPSIEQPWESGIDWVGLDIERTILLDLYAAHECRSSGRLSLENFDRWLADCTVGRSEYFGIPRTHTIPATEPAQAVRWADIRRSEISNWRPSRAQARFLAGG